MPDADLWLALRDLPGLGPRRVRALLDRFGSARAIFAQGAPALRAVCPPATAAAIARGPVLAPARAELARARELGLEARALDDPGFPETLREIPDPPLVLYCRGEAGSGPRVAMVGSRRATARGRQVARELAAALARAGVAVVSGLAYGIDAAAHDGALEGGGATVAVLASGLDRPSPRGNLGLARRILAGGGAWISELPPGAASLPAHFPERNRLISGLAALTVVVEARAPSGTLWTARHALEQGRELLAVPGPIDTAACLGSNRLLRDGAHPVLEVDDILSALARVHPCRGAAPAGERPAEPASPLLALLREGPADPDRLARALDLAPAELAALLLELELDGAIVREGRRIALARGPARRELS